MTKKIYRLLIVLSLMATGHVAHAQWTEVSTSQELNTVLASGATKSS